MFQMSLCRALRQTISDAAYRNQSDKVISLNRILKVVKENYWYPLRVVLIIFPFYFILYNTQICYSNFNWDGQDAENKINNIIYLVFYPLAFIIEFYLPIKSIQINYYLYRECIKAYKEAVRMARIKGFLMRRVEENIRFMQGYPTINTIVISFMLVQASYRFFIVLIFEIFYTDSQQCSNSEYCKWNCYTNG